MRLKNLKSFYSYLSCCADLAPHHLFIKKMAAAKKITSAVVDADAEDLHPSLRNIIEQETLNWIFVGGKGFSSIFLLYTMATTSLQAAN